MLNYIWAFMIVAAIIIAAFTGRLDAVTNSALDTAKEAVTLCITMLGIMSMWTGLMKIAETGGLIKSLSRRMTPLLKFLFPDLHPKSAAISHISTNMIANMLGLGWAATPAGLKAMEEMQKLNPEKDKASRSMCMFLIVNMSSLQLVTMNLIVFRTQYHSASPTEIIGPGLFATLISTIVGITAAKILEKFYFR